MLNGKLIEKTALSGSIQSRTIYSGGGDAPIKSISVDGVEIEPDNKKNVNIDLSGKVDKTTEALKIYGTDSQGNQVQWIFRNTNNTKNTVAGRDSNGNIQVGTAVNSTDATNKQYVDDRFNGASKPISYDTYSEMITALNGMSATDLNRGQDIFIVQTGIPDVWVAYIEEANVPYTYVDDATFVNELLASGTVQVGYYKLGYLETQKVDLTNYATVSQVNSKVQKVTYSKDDTLPAGSDAGYFGRVYLRDWVNKDNSVPVALQSFNFTIPIRDANGNFYVSNPTQNYHCVNKLYLDTLVGDLNTALESILGV